MTVEQSEKSGLAALFDACRDENRAALIGYLPTGYPDVPTSIEAMTALIESGCDIIEVGVPYSDPGMDGPTIANADRGRTARRSAGPRHVDGRRGDQRGRRPCRGHDVLESGVALWS